MASKIKAAFTRKVPNCVFHNCENSLGQWNRFHGLALHAFPTNQTSRQRWIDVVRSHKGDPDWTPTKYCKVCTLHFHPNYIIRTSKGESRISREGVPYATVVTEHAEVKNGRCCSWINVTNLDVACTEETVSAVSDLGVITLNPAQTEEEGSDSSIDSAEFPIFDTNETNCQDEINESETNDSVDEENVEESNMDVPQDKIEKPDDIAADNLAANETQPSDSKQEKPDSDLPSDSKQEKPKESNPVPLDKFKRRLVRAVARKIQQNKPEQEMWQELKKEIGCDCYMLWQHMRALTLKKLKRLLPANDMLANLKKIARFTATDWLLFDLILVHEKVNVIGVNETAEEDFKEEPQCLHDLFELVKQHNVEMLTGDDLIEAWIRVTLQYNSGGRQSSAMLLQLRWYQLKELTRARFYNFWCQYRGNHKILDRAMKVKPTVLQKAIAEEYKKIITQSYPEWEKLIEERRVILSEEFTLNREAKRKEKTREENDVEIEVIEPLVETIELEVDSDEDVNNSEETSNTENKNIIEDVKEQSTHNADEKKIRSHILNTVKTIKSESESEDDVLELDGLSDIETMDIPLEELHDKESEIESERNPSEICSEEVLNTNTNEILPKITNVIGNIDQLIELTNDQEMSIVSEKNIADDNESEKSEIMTVVDHCTESKDKATMQCDSDGEIDSILHEKVNNLMNIEITQIKSECDPIKEIITEENNFEIFEKSIKEKDIMNDKLCSANIVIRCDSDDEMEKLLQEKANNFIGIKTSQENVVLRKESPNENVNLCETITDDEEANQNTNNEKDEVSKPQKAVKNDRHDEGFDEVEFDDDQIEFVDDGIEFIEELEGDKKKEINVKEEPLNDSENESETNSDDYPKIDLKLLMNPIVYTKKIDMMDIFKCTDFEYVNDAKVIECAIFESKPVDKQALKDEDINKFREQSIRGYETEGTQSDDDIETADDHANDRIKCTSWLLQKPKNRNYNPIQLCKNPDFNTRLKRLTSGFLSSTRNRFFLKECKPLTIDLHKAFEHKLINGTMYLKSGDFKSANSDAVDKINNKPVSVVPSVIPGQNMIITANTINNISPVVPDNLNSDENTLPLSPTVQLNVSSERRKVINLPDIDQVRRVNQSLLTAEVTPIRIDSNTKSCTETVKTASTVEPATEPKFVQPIVLTSLAQIKNEPSESDQDDKNKLQSQVNLIQYESTSRKDIMVNKINDQIINLSNQISEVDNNDHLCIDIVRTAQKQPKVKNKIGRKPKNDVPKSKFPQPSNKLTNLPRFKGKLTWSPKYPTNHIADSLLTLDTLSRILFLLNGNEDIPKYGSGKKKKLVKVTNNPQSQSKIKQIRVLSDGQSTLTKSISENRAIQAKSKASIQRGAAKKRGRKPQNPSELKKYNGIYCCWAREKIINISKNKDFDSTTHGCHVYCLCCCRQELVALSSSNSRRTFYSINSKNVSSAIVLSDDEDTNKDNQPNETVMKLDTKSVLKTVSENRNLKTNVTTSNVIIEKSDKVTIEIVIPPLTSIDPTTTGADSNITNVNELAIQTETSQENFTNDIHNSEKLTNKKINVFKKRKTCKTVVHAADGYTHKGTEYISNTHKEKKLLTPVNPHKLINTVDKESPKQPERTLFLNSNQILSKPTKSPIYLGKNRILLCSLKNPSVATTPVNPYVPVLPLGVHFVMLPNGELTLSIDNGTQLDSEQLSALPALMSIVQEQFLKSSISNKDPNEEGIQQKNYNGKVTEESNLPKQVISNSVEHLQNSEANQNKSMQSDSSDSTIMSSLATDQNIITEDKSMQSDSSPASVKSSNGQNIISESLSTDSNCDASFKVGSENDTPAHITCQSEVVDTESSCKESGTEPETTNTQIENQDSQINAENQVNISDTTQAEPCLTDNSDVIKDSENKNTNTRKTLLSDLMEMSGISAEDTTPVSDVTNSNPLTLPPTIIPVTRTKVCGSDVFNMPTNSSNVPDNISVAGPYSNLHLFEPTTPLNNLLNCIALIRPELNAVTTFAELKYVYENDGKFYKLDVDTGSISEIKVFIKKNPKLRSPVVPKAFIDLTDDKCDNEDVVTCAEYQDISQGKHGNTEVKPIKLFRAVHPTILKRCGRSILNDNEIIYPKKAIRINKERRKQLLNIGNKYILVDIDKGKQAKESTDLPSQGNQSSYLDSSYDSSDEEPLAKKCKRIRVAEDNQEEPAPLFREPHDSVSEEVGDIPNSADNTVECDDSSDLEMNDIEGVNPELHPVAFEEGSESDEDMCILGV